MAWHPTWNEPTGREGGRYRSVRMGWQGARRGTPGMWTLLLGTIGVFLLLQSRDPNTPINLFGPLTAEAVILKGQVWRLLTFQLLHGDFWHLFWNMFGLWMFGRTVETQLGTRRFVWLYVACGIVGGLSECALNFVLQANTGLAYATVPIVGASAGVMGVVIAFAVLNPNATLLVMFILPMRAKWLAVGYFALTTMEVMRTLQLSGELGGGTMVAHAAHLGGMLCALVWLVLAGYVNRPWALRIRSFFIGSRQRLSRPKPARRQHPVVGGTNDSGSSGQTRRQEEQLDEILRKIHDRGLGALTDKERQFLRDISERKRDDVDFDDHYRRQ